jgi:hypothetical protein
VTAKDENNTCLNALIEGGIFDVIQKTKAMRIPPKDRGQLWGCFGRVNRSCSTSGTRRVTLVTNLMICHERGTDREVFAPSGTYSWSFVTQIYRNGLSSHVGDHNTFEVMTASKPI